jgi:hypothetical protein
LKTTSGAETIEQCRGIARHAKGADVVAGRGQRPLHELGSEEDLVFRISIGVVRRQDRLIVQDKNSEAGTVGSWRLDDHLQTKPKGPLKSSYWASKIPHGVSIE